MKPVVLTPHAWRLIRDELHKENPKSVFALRSKMRKLLGFTVREHREYVVNNKFTEQQARGEDAAHGHYIDVVHLDFYSESRRTFFLMKYSELINNDGKKI